MRKIQCQFKDCKVTSCEEVRDEWADEIEEVARGIEDGCIFGCSGDNLEGFCAKTGFKMEELND